MLTSQAESGFDIKRLKELRKRAGLSQAELAERSGIIALTITHIETGLTGKPHPKTVAKLYAALSACFQGGLPEGEGVYADGLCRAACPHCGAQNCHTLEVLIPGIEFQCVSCSRTFRLDEKGRAYVPGPTPAPARVLLMHEMSEAARARISAGQRRRHARERAEEDKP